MSNINNSDTLHILNDCAFYTECYNNCPYIDESIFRDCKCEPIVKYNPIEFADKKYLPHTLQELYDFLGSNNTYIRNNNFYFPSINSIKNLSTEEFVYFLKVYTNFAPIKLYIRKSDKKVIAIYEDFYEQGNDKFSKDRYTTDFESLFILLKEYNFDYNNDNIYNEINRLSHLPPSQS
jgi:hypothetical protein